MINNLNNIDEILELLAEFILSETILSKDNIKTKCKVFLVSWQRVNKRPKNNETNISIIADADKYHILKKYINTVFIKHFDKFKIIELMNNFYKIENVIK